MKAVVVSLHRSATRSTVAHLQHLGLRTTHYITQDRKKEFRRAILGRETDLDHVFSVIAPALAGYDAAGDVPVPVLYRQFEAHYPEAKFLLVTRDPAGWAKSVREHIGTRPFAAPEKVQYWQYFPNRPERIGELTDDQLVAMYWEHTARVEAHFLGRSEKLGVFQIGEADTPQRIAAFLGIDSSKPFPHVRHDERKRTPLKRLAERIARRIFPR
jgi:hypothetical protein